MRGNNLFPRKNKVCHPKNQKETINQKYLKNENIWTTFSIENISWEKAGNIYVAWKYWNRVCPEYIFSLFLINEL